MLCLVTLASERHEDHIPVGVYEYEVLCEDFHFTSIDGRDWGYKSQLAKDLISDGKWHGIYVMDSGDEFMVIMIGINRKLSQS